MEIDYDYLRTGIAIGFRAFRELCSNFLLLLARYMPNIAKKSSLYEIIVILRTDRLTFVPGRAFLEELQTAIYP